MTDIIWNANYWASRLQKTSDDVAPILRKINHNCHSTSTLTIEEQYRVTEALRHYATYSKLLTEDLAEYNSRPKPVPFWKKLFRRK